MIVIGSYWRNLTELEGTRWLLDHNCRASFDEGLFHLPVTQDDADL